MEGEARVPDEPLADLGVRLGGVVVEDGADRLAGGHLCFDQVEKADEFLMAVALHVAADHIPVEHVERSKQRCGERGEAEGRGRARSGEPNWR